MWALIFPGSLELLFQWTFINHICLIYISLCSWGSLVPVSVSLFHWWTYMTNSCILLYFRIIRRTRVWFAVTLWFHSPEAAVWRCVWIHGSRGPRPASGPLHYQSACTSCTSPEPPSSPCRKPVAQSEISTLCPCTMTHSFNKMVCQNYKSVPN